MLIMFEHISGPGRALVSEAWTVLAAARDLGDIPTALRARNIIDDALHNKTPRAVDVEIIQNYFGRE